MINTYESARIPLTIPGEDDVYWESLDRVDRKWVSGQEVWSETGPKTTRWYVGTVTHRTGGPAVTRTDGTKEWYRRGEFHRIDGPAVESPTRLGWYVFGREFEEKDFADRFPEGYLGWWESQKGTPRFENAPNWVKERFAQSTSNPFDQKPGTRTQLQMYVDMNDLAGKAIVEEICPHGKITIVGFVMLGGTTRVGDVVNFFGADSRRLSPYSIVRELYTHGKPSLFLEWPPVDPKEFVATFHGTIPDRAKFVTFHIDTLGLGKKGAERPLRSGPIR